MALVKRRVKNFHSHLNEPSFLIQVDVAFVTIVIEPNVNLAADKSAEKKKQYMALQLIASLLRSICAPDYSRPI